MSDLNFWFFQRLFPHSSETLLITERFFSPPRAERLAEGFSSFKSDESVKRSSESSVSVKQKRQEMKVSSRPKQKANNTPTNSPSFSTAQECISLTAFMESISTDFFLIVLLASRRCSTQTFKDRTRIEERFRRSFSHFLESSSKQARWKRLLFSKCFFEDSLRMLRLGLTEKGTCLHQAS